MLLVMAKPQNTKFSPENPPETPSSPEKTIAFHGVCRENGGWSLYEFQIPVSWLADAKQLRSVDSMHGVLSHMRLACVKEAENG